MTDGSYTDTDYVPYVNPDIAEVGALIEQSQTWASGIDRSGLGSFAIPDDALIAFQASERLRRDKSANFRLGNEMDKRIWQLGYGRFDTSKKHLRAIAEVYLWWSLHDPEMSAYISRRCSNLPYLSDMLDRLLRVYENPEHLPYYEAGVWDDVLISQFIGNGVDASLALEMMLNRIVSA